MIVRVTLAEAEVPTELVAVTLKSVAPIAAAGVPEITQVEVSKVNPVGRAGAIAQFVIAAPLAERVVGETDIGEPNVPLVPVAPA